MAQSIDDIIRELDAGYNPQRQAINDRLSQLPGQADAQINGLRAEQDNAFGQITNEARGRGIGFSGIPIAEQAKYTSSSFLPAVARVRQSQNDAKSSLTDALNGINLEQRTKAFGVRESQLGREQEESQFTRGLAAQKSAAGGDGSGALAGLFGGGGGVPPAAGQPQQAQALSGNKSVQNADSAVRSLLNTNNADTIIKTYNAIAASARKGNTYDQAKIQLLQKYKKGWFIPSKANPSGFDLDQSYIMRLGKTNNLKSSI